MIRRLAIIAPLLAFAAFVALVLSRPQQPKADPTLVGHAVPAFDLPGLDALHPGLSDADLRHGTVTVVNLFASWCLPCRVEAPQLKALQARGLVVHGIAVADKPADTRAFVRQFGDPFARVGLDADRKVSKAFRIGGLPETFVVDGHGTIVLHHVGEIRPETIPEIVAAVAKARGR